MNQPLSFRGYVVNGSKSVSLRVHLETPDSITFTRYYGSPPIRANMQWRFSQEGHLEEVVIGRREEEKDLVLLEKDNPDFMKVINHLNRHNKELYCVELINYSPIEILKILAVKGYKYASILESDIDSGRVSKSMGRLKTYERQLKEILKFPEVRNMIKKTTMSIPRISIADDQEKLLKIDYPC